jgi:hypothetical protein
VAGSCENGNEPSGSIRKQAIISFLNNVLHHAIGK